MGSEKIKKQDLESNLINKNHKQLNGFNTQDWIFPFLIHLTWYDIQNEMNLISIFFNKFQFWLLVNTHAINVDVKHQMKSNGDNIHNFVLW